LGTLSLKNPANAGFFFIRHLVAGKSSRKGLTVMEFRIYYEDTDAGGVVYHANYLGFFERGRTEYLRERGLSVADLANRGFIFPVLHLEITYRSAAVLDDLVRVETEILKVGKTSFVLGQQVVRVLDGMIMATGKVTLVCTSPAMKARRLPDEILQALANR
jgi:acyl-CoA thioester hydrolase